VDGLDAPRGEVGSNAPQRFASEYPFSSFADDVSLVCDEGHAVAGVAEWSDAAAAYLTCLRQFQLFPSQPAADLLYFLPGDSPLDTCHHPTLRSCKVNVATDSGKRDLVSVGEIKELF